MWLCRLDSYAEISNTYHPSPRCLDLDQDLDGVADQEAPRLQRGVPVQAEVLAVDGGLGGEASHFRAPRVLATAIQGGVEHDFAGGAANSEVADDLEAVAAPG